MFHSTMKFTAEYSNVEVSFLDLNIKLTDGVLQKDLFVKSFFTSKLSYSSLY